MPVEARCLFTSGAYFLDDGIALFCVHDPLVGRLLVFVSGHEQEPGRWARMCSYSSMLNITVSKQRSSPHSQINGTRCRASKR